MKSKKLKLSIAKILTVVSIVGMMGVAIGPKLGLEVCQVHAEGPGDGTNDKCLTQEEAVKLVQDEKNYSHDSDGNVVFTIPDNYDSIGPHAFDFKVNKGFENCEKWKSLNKIAPCRDFLAFEIRSRSKVEDTGGLVIRLGSKVKEIGEHAFSRCSMYRIILPDGLESLGKYAFAGAWLLTEITIPENLTSIPTACFSSCKNLKTVHFVNQANIKLIGDRAFAHCSSIKEFTVPGSIYSISPYCFSGCANLKKINFVNPTNIESIGTEAFQGTKLKKFTVPPNVSSISKYCFWNCNDLETIDFADPSKIQSIECGAFSNCSSMREITIPKNIGSISSDCFRECRALEKINFVNLDNIKSIGKCAFFECSNLKLFIIPESVETISNACFYGCKSLQLKIPDNIQHIEHHSLVNCKIISGGTGNLILGPNNKSISLDSFSGTDVNSIESLGKNLYFTITYYKFDDGSLPLTVSFPNAAVINIYAGGQLGEQNTSIFIPANTQFNIISQK